MRICFSSSSARRASSHSNATSCTSTSRDCRVGTEPSAVAPGQMQVTRPLHHVDPALPRSVLCLSYSEVELLLMYRLVALDVDWTKIILDLHHHIPLACAQGLRHLGIDSQRDLLVVLVAVEALAQSSRLFEQLVTDRLRRLHQSRALAILARRAQRPLQRLLHAFARHDHQTEV